MTMSRAEVARLGGLARAKLYDGREVTAKARATFIESFLAGHVCKVCPEVVLPADMTPVERQRRADELHALHYVNVRAARVRKASVG